jgi:hypothetical protein
MTDHESDGQKGSETYERPTLVVIGNLKDLLAGSGSLGIDDTTCAANNGTDPTC